jgi:hypothetical protein
MDHELEMAAGQADLLAQEEIHQREIDQTTTELLLEEC